MGFVLAQLRKIDGIRVNNLVTIICVWKYFTMYQLLGTKTQNNMVISVFWFKLARVGPKANTARNNLIGI